MDLPRLLALPRSVLLALWLEGVGSAAAPLQDALDAVQDEDEPHTVMGPPDFGPAGGHLADLIAAWATGPRQVCAALPVPGDVTGVPAVISAEAVGAGEAVLVRCGERSWAAVPQIVGFGSVYEPGHLVTWVVHEVPDWRPTLTGASGTVAQAEQDLRQGLLAATAALAALDVARWRPEAAQAIVALRSDGELGWDLPPGVEQRRLRVLVTAARLRAIVSLAVSDDGGAVNLWQADQRSAALREVDRSARHAMVAATLAGQATADR